MAKGQVLRWMMGLAGLMLVCDVPSAAAQRPFMRHDPFYLGESARRSFFDGYALSGEIAYRPMTPSASEMEGTPGAAVNPLGLAFRFDYQLARQLDLGVILNAGDGRSGRSLSVSWLVLKYYDYTEGTNLAFRLAVDPASDGLVGFPQMDLAVLATSLLTPFVTNDVAIGMRRVRVGYERLVRPGSPSDEAAPEAPDGMLEVVYTRVMGWELHVSTSYKYHFDPAGSHVFLSLLAEGGKYDLYEAARPDEEAGPSDASNGDAEAEEALTTTFQSGVVWLRSGIQYNRPSYQISPFVGIPLVQWISADDEALRARLSAGLRLTIR